MCSQLTRNSSLNPKNCYLALRNLGWDPGSQIRDPEETYPGSALATDPQHCSLDPLFRNFYNRNA
jgi:hypothetical protein